MKKTLAQLFMESSGRPIEYEGLTVHGSMFKRVNKDGEFIVRFIKAVPSPLQALCIDIDPGKLVIENTESSRMILRLDTSPAELKVFYQPGRKACRISFYNAWINEDGGIDSWLVNSGMIVEETGNKIALRCSDGRGEPTFDDLIVEIEFLDD